MALNMLQEWKKAQEETCKSGTGVHVHTRQWCPPPEGWIKINIDASCRQDSEYVGVGCVVRNERGEFLRARTTLVQGRSYAREAEALSLKEALSWVKTWRTQKCIFESDAKLLVDAIHAGHGNSIFDTIVEDCRELIKHFQEVLVMFVLRSANNVAHSSAQAACSMSGPQEWYHTAPDFILCNLAPEGS
ncbi:uncharacterized protein LOC108226171 [Daucus carota subsp. sativus]|uniref:uncharacterized protein LOC108226171 n=1 Tax=Daucus carota subsp. sativus TaxID=79200 RepID=UPI0007F02548|nr:PREDICTED: uncharacterized protein LOC108226171 [Daucus carota subsp. sativus]